MVRHSHLSLPSFHSVAVVFAILCPQHWIFVGEFKRFNGSIYRNLRELSLFILYVNKNDFESPWLWDVNRGNSYILIALICWLVPVATDSLVVFIRSNILSNRWESTLKARSIRAWTKERQIMSILPTLYIRGNTRISHTVRSLF